MSGRDPLPVSEHAELMRSALDHIARTARKSRTSTRRLRWIEQRAELAIAGEPYSNDSFDLPKDAGPETQERLKLELVRQKANCNELVIELRSLLTVVHGLDLENEDERPTEEVYVAALARADAVVARYGSNS